MGAAGSGVAVDWLSQAHANAANAMSPAALHRCAPLFTRAPVLEILTLAPVRAVIHARVQLVAATLVADALGKVVLRVGEDGPPRAQLNQQELRGRAAPRACDVGQRGAALAL